MNTEPYGTTVFCDDIRYEINGKLTLIGCYTTEMNFRGPFPGTLPMFAALIQLRIPEAVPFNSIKIRVIKEEGSEKNEIFETDINFTDDDRKEAFPGGAENDEERVFLMTFPLQWSSFQMKESGFIRVRAYLDGDKEVRIGSLKVNFSSETSDQMEP